MPLPRVLALDCGDGHVSYALITSDKSGRLRLERFALETFNPDAALEAEWSTLLGQALADLVRRDKISGPVQLTLPGHHTLTKFIKTPAVEQAKRQKIIQFEAQQNIPYPLSEVAWGHLTVSDDGLDLEIMLAATKLDVVEDMCRAVVATGLPVAEVTPSSVGVLRCFRYNYPEVADCVLLVDVGARSTNLIFVDSKHFFIRTIPLAGNSVTQAISEEIKQDFAHSESLKVQILTGTSDLPESSPARAAVNHAVHNFISKLHLEITRSTVNYRRQSGAAQPATIYLTGGGSLLATLPAQLSERLKTPVERMDPLRNVDVMPAAAAAADYLVELPSLIGVAAGDAHSGGTLSLLPPSIGGKLAFRKRQPVLVAAVALLALSFLPPLVQSQRLLGAYQRQIESVDRNILPLQKIQDRNSTNLARVEEATRQIESIRSLVESKSNWINFLTDLQERLYKVGDVWLENLEVLRPGGAEAPVAGGGGLFGGAAAAAEPTADGEPVEVVRLQLSGRLVDIKNPTSPVSQDSYAQVEKLLKGFVDSPFINAVESERFDSNQPGILRFDFNLVVDPNHPL